MADSGWQTFDIPKLVEGLQGKSVEYREFLNVDALSCGLYHLDAGSKDMQSPHDEDEVYYVISRRAQLSIGEKVREVSAGSLLYISATEEHTFFEIEEDMTLLVFFAATAGND